MYDGSNIKDCTVIAYDRSGNGAAVIIVNGAFGHRDYYGDRELASELSRQFTVIIYDRRGRGESTDTQPYAVEREIEDTEALIDASGGKHVCTASPPSCPGLKGRRAAR